jgi:class 3 adenylate cyclase
VNLLRLAFLILAVTWNGVIDRYIGDAIMALFGAPGAQGDAADRALHSFHHSRLVRLAPFP